MVTTQISNGNSATARRSVGGSPLRLVTFRNGASTGLLLALVLSGYPLAGYLTDVIAIQGNMLSVVFRVAMVVLSLYVTAVYFDGRKLFGAWVVLLLFWWLLYAIRLCMDFLVGEPLGAGRALLFYGMVVVAPSFALLFSDRKHLDRTVGPAVFWVSALVVCAALVFQYSGLLGSRSLMALTGRLSSYSVNSITLGHIASSLIIAVLATSWLRGKVWIGLKLAGVGAGLVCIVLSASKGAFLALLMSLVFLVAVKVRSGKVATLLFLTSVAVLAVVVDWDYRDLPLWERVVNMRSDASTTIRLQLYADAYQQFLDNPVLGSAYVERNSGTYPHNLILESFMSLGIVGGVLFIILNIAGMNRSWKCAMQGRVLLPMLYVQAFTSSLFSGALYAHAPLWAMLAIILSPALPASASVRETT